MNARFVVTAVSSMLLLACSGPPPAPVEVGDSTIFTFAPVGPQAFLAEPDAGALDRALRDMLETAGTDGATRALANRWVQPPGWAATVEAFGEPTDGDLYASRGYPYRTNLVDAASGVVVLAYTKERPAADVWKPNSNVHVSGRLEGYARQAPGIVILLDASLQEASAAEGTAGAAGAVGEPGTPGPR